MRVKNMSARLVTINLSKSKKFKLAPFDEVDLPDDLGIAQAFVENLIGYGELIEVAGPKKENPIAQPSPVKRGRPAKGADADESSDDDQKAD